MKLLYKEIRGWPQLAWCATSGNDRVDVMHGVGVETFDNWFAEGVWPGEFEAGGLDETDLLAGSGARIKNGQIIFSSSGNTVDRLVSIQIDGVLQVSNSLAILLACTGATIDPSYPNYFEDFVTIIEGLKRYRRELKSSRGTIWITYFGFLKWNGNRIERDFKPMIHRDFGNFTRYRGFLSETMLQTISNASSRTRKQPLLPTCTVSSGYDSPMIAVLAKEAGCTDAICINKDRSSIPERGDEIARTLSLTPLVIDRDAWRGAAMPEIPFLAADGTAEAIPLAAAERWLRGRILFVGYHGDKMWAKDTKNLSDEIVRGDASGLSMSEFRLIAGFVVCAPAFWGVRQIRDVNAISNSIEMRVWDIPGEYSRPICRRIVETAGVSRDKFGIEKRASAVGFTEFLTDNSMHHYRQWLAANRFEWIRRGRLPPITGPSFEEAVRLFEKQFDRIVKRVPYLWRLAFDKGIERPGPLRRYAFAWALGILAGRYAKFI